MAHTLRVTPMQSVLPHNRSYSVSSRVSFDLSTCDGLNSFTLYRSASNPLDGRVEQFIQFSSQGVFKTQLERLVRRISQPSYRLARVPWSRCWPPYRTAGRKNAYFLGSLSGHSDSERKFRRCLTFALLPDRQSDPIVCIDRFGESVFFLPKEVFGVILDSLEKDPCHEQGIHPTPSNVPI